MSYEQTNRTGTTYHGLFYVNVRPRGNGVAMDVFEKGKADGADSENIYLQIELTFGR